MFAQAARCAFPLEPQRTGRAAARDSCRRRNDVAPPGRPLVAGDGRMDGRALARPPAARRRPDSDARVGRRGFAAERTRPV